MGEVRKVLVVDDHAINRKILCQILDGEYEVLCAENGLQALEILKGNSGSISAVLLDIVMPVMNGFGVLREMRTNAFLSNIPVIVCTQMNEEQSELKALELGASDFLPKPYNVGILRKRLSNLIQMKEATATVNILEKDMLTGLYNKEAFYHNVEKFLICNQGKEYDIVAVNIDHFKLINDTYGEEEGNRLLQYIAQKIDAVTRTQESIAARVYADQFIMLVERKEGYIEKMLEDTSRNLENYPLDMKVYAKFGIYQIKKKNMSVSIMCDRALVAVRQVKGQYGLDYAFYDDSIRMRLLREQQITDNMVTGLKQGQFEVYLQPKYDIRTERIAGAEALVRWIHPERGFLTPGEFIPIFEKNGFITELDMYIWEKTCEYMAHWMKVIHKCVPVSVNVSRKDIYKRNLPDIFKNLVKKYGLEPRQLHLEITESAYTDNASQLIETVSELKAAGFVIEMDDFGSGYSSLNMLSRLPIDILKLDTQFVQGEQNIRNRNNVISSVINLAKWMNLLIIAEGVETKSQLDCLKEMKCNYVQGFYFARPLTGGAFMELLEQSEIENEEKIKGQLIYHPESGNKKEMLIVDDFERNREILAEYFEEVFTIVEADNGMTAWEYMKEAKDRIAVIILDVYMPVMNGYQLLENIREDEAYNQIPVIVTSTAGMGIEEKVLEMGANGFLAKPYSEKEAFQMVDGVIYEIQKQFKEKVRA